VRCKGVATGGWRPRILVMRRLLWCRVPVSRTRHRHPPGSSGSYSGFTAGGCGTADKYGGRVRTGISRETGAPAGRGDTPQRVSGAAVPHPDLPLSTWARAINRGRDPGSTATAVAAFQRWCCRCSRRQIADVGKALQHEDAVLWWWKIEPNYCRSPADLSAQRGFNICGEDRRRCAHPGRAST